MDEGSLYELWIQYTNKNETKSLEAFLDAFLIKFDRHLKDDSKSEKAPLLRELPSRLLQIFLHEITRFQQQEKMLLSEKSIETDRFMKLLKAFFILTRNPENSSLLSSAGVVAVFTDFFIECLQMENGDKFSTFSGSLLCNILDPNQSWKDFLESGCQKFPLFEEQKPSNENSVRKHSLNENSLTLESVLNKFTASIIDNLEKGNGPTQLILCILGSALAGSKTTANGVLHDNRIVRCLLSMVARLPDDVDSFEQLGEKETTNRKTALSCLTLLIYVLSRLVEKTALDFTVVIADCLETFSKLKPSSKVGVEILVQMLNAFTNICNFDARGYTSSCLIDLHMVSLLSNHLNICIDSKVDPESCNQFTISLFRSLRSLSRFSKPDKSSQLIVEWPDLFAVVRKINEPSQSVLDSCLSLSHPEDVIPGSPHTLVARELILWLPQLNKELQENLSERIFLYLFDKKTGDLDLLTCSQHEIVDTVLNVVVDERLTDLAFVRLLETLHKIGTISLTSMQLKKLISLCRPTDDRNLPSHALFLLQSLRLMLRPTSEPRPGAIFAFHSPGHSIHVQKLHRLPHRSSFSLFLWLRFTATPATRTIFRIATKTGCSVECEINSNGLLLITQSSPKGSHILARLDASTLVSETKWHNLCIVFTPVGMLASGKVLCYVDGKQIYEPVFGSKLSLTTEGASSLPSALWNGLKDLLSNFKIGDVGFERNNGSWLMGDVFIFDQAIGQDQIQTIGRTPFSEISLLSQTSKMTVKPIAHYTARCYNKTNQVLDDLTGNGYCALCNIDTFNVFDVRDMFGCIGGPGVLFPFIYYAASRRTGDPNSEKEKAATMMSGSLGRKISGAHGDSNTIVSCCFSCLTELFTGLSCRSTIAAINWMLSNEGCASLGHLLSKLPADYINVDVLTAVQMLIDRLYAEHVEVISSEGAQKMGDQQEAIASSLQQLLHQLYQHVLFNFDIWGKADYVVQVGCL